MSLNDSKNNISCEEKLNDIKLYVPTTKYLNSPLSNNTTKSRHLSIASGSNRLNFNYSPDLRKSYFKSKNLLSNGFPFNYNNKTTNSKNSSYIDISSNTTSFRQNSQFDLNKIKSSNSKTNSTEYIQHQLNSLNNSLSNFDTGFEMTTRTYEKKYSKFFIFFCCLCCIIKNCLESSSQNELTMTSLTTSNEKQGFFKFYIKKFYLKLKFYSVGFLMSFLICVSFVSMTYLLRRALNLIEVTQETSNSNNLNDFSLIINNIELNKTQIVLNCNFCYFVIWSSTSCLLLVYPIYFLAYLLVYRLIVSQRAKKSKTESTLISNSSSSGLSQSKFKINDFVLSSFDIFSNDRQLKKKAKIEYKSPVNNNSVKNQNNSNAPNQQKSADSNNTHNNVSQFKIKRNFFLKILLISIIWILTGYSLIRAIDLLSCSDVIILYSVNYSFIYMAAWIILHHQFIPLRLLGFILSIAAIIFTYYSEGFAFNLKLFGNVCATASAAGSAILQIVWNNNTKIKRNNQRTMFISLIGLCTFLFGWPIIFFLRITGVETLTFNSYQFLSITQFKEIFICIIGASIFGFIFIFSMQFGQLITKELFLQIGCIFTIPASVVLDMEVNKLKINDLKYGALICVCIGYIFLILPENMYSDCKKFLCPDSAQEATGSNSLTRRYRYSTPASPSPTNNPNRISNSSVNR